MPDRTCSIEGCQRRVQARGWCNTHYQQRRERGEFEARPFYRPDAVCSVSGCRRKPCALGMCWPHRKRLLDTGSVEPRPRPSWQSQFWDRVHPEPNTGCWLWGGTTAEARGGYGIFAVEHDGTHRAHIIAYELEVGPVPTGLVLDHLCRVTCCVNPDHLEPVTHGVNVLRGMAPGAVAWRTNTCRSGEHKLTPENTYTAPSNGRRQCRACMTRARRAWTERKHATDRHGSS